MFETMCDCVIMIQIVLKLAYFGRYLLMKWYKDLYVTPKMAKKKVRIKWKLDHGAGVVGTYLLVLPETNYNQLEIINSIYIKQPYYRNRDMIVIGLAESEIMAYELLLIITEETFKNTKDANIRSYLLQKHQNS